MYLRQRAIVALKAQKAKQDAERREASDAWHANDLVFCHENGTPYTSDALNWRFSKMTRKAGIGHWHAHEGRHTAVSIMSSNGVPIQEISDTVGHKSTHVTETRLPARDRPRHPRRRDGDGQRLRPRRRSKRLNQS
jgi:integrase